MIETHKAGCVLVNIKQKKIGLIYRDELNDYSFPKGHVEKGEDYYECAIREIEEETGRICEIQNSDLYINGNYISPDSNEGLCIVRMFLAVDKGKSTRVFDANLVHELIWVDIDEVEEKLTYQNLKDIWLQFLPRVKKLIL